MMKRLSLLVMVMAVVFAASSAQAYVIRDSTNFSSTLDQIEGDVLPGTLGSWDNLGGMDSLTTLNGDGTMEITLSDSAWSAWKANPGTLNAAIGWTYEIRLRVDSQASTAAALDIMSRDNTGGLVAPWLSFFTDGIGDRSVGYGSEKIWDADLSSDFATVRLAYQPGDPDGVSVWVDGQLLTTNVAGDSYNAGPHIFIGRWSGGTDGGTTTIDYIRFDTTGGFAPVPEPATLALMAFGGIAAFRRRRRA